MTQLFPCGATRSSRVLAPAVESSAILQCAALEDYGKSEQRLGHSIDGASSGSSENKHEVTLDFNPSMLQNPLSLRLYSLGDGDTLRGFIEGNVKITTSLAFYPTFSWLNPTGSMGRDSYVSTSSPGSMGQDELAGRLMSATNKRNGARKGTLTVIKQAITTTVSDSLGSFPEGADIHLPDGTVYVGNTTDDSTQKETDTATNSAAQAVTVKAVQQRAALMDKQKGYIQSNSDPTTVCNMMSSSQGNEPGSLSRASYASATKAPQAKKVVRVKANATQVPYNIHNYSQSIQVQDEELVNRGASGGPKGKRGLTVK